MLLRSVDRASGRLRWTLVKATEFEDDQGRRLAVNVIEDVTNAKEQELRQRFLVRVSEVLGSSLDYHETMQRVARLAVPELADWCAVEMTDGNELRQVAVAHVDPSKIEFARELRKRYPPRLDEPTGIGAVVRTGRPEFYPAILEELLAASVRDQEHLGLLRDLQMRSVMIVPMRSRGRVIGAITFVAAETAGAFDEDDLAFLEDFAARAASAIDNARLYRERTETAQTLQRSLLPARLPEVPGWRLATPYRAADHASHIGGDFYDLFPTGDGFTVVMGDVTGKGITAATLTALTPTVRERARCSDGHPPRSCRYSTASCSTNQRSRSSPPSSRNSLAPLEKCR